MSWIMQAQAVFPFFTGDPSDVWTNRFHFEVADDMADPASVAVFITDALKTFYTTIYPSASDRANYVAWGLAVVKCYDQRDVVPRPLYEIPLSASPLTSSATSTIPTEVAVVASWRAQQVPGIRYQSMYNRIYLGGLIAAQMQPSSASAYPTILNTFAATICGAMSDLQAYTTDGFQWVQVGKGLGGPQTYRPIIGGFVDNSPDTQRRRSVEASSRTLWTV
uniref:Uncharacterized protein n=1 Tax=uncultured prokaryote TaxID=198431 RepID=A0A0H5Q786_9ZZZZ|nr:hypothetical protein [uncultured prokaryote]